jgi:hypothetical protein
MYIDNEKRYSLLTQRYKNYIIALLWLIYTKRESVIEMIVNMAVKKLLRKTVDKICAFSFDSNYEFFIKIIKTSDDVL